jgi:hypothetical protein
MKLRMRKMREIPVHWCRGREAIDKNWDRDRAGLSPRTLTQTLARAYLRDLRAAEMMAWQMTGGDYLVLSDLDRSQCRAT